MTQELSYIKIKTANEARLADEARTETLKRNIIVLVLHHLQDNGYVQAAHQLELEAGIAATKYDVCDNIDLLSIVQEFEAYYKIKFGKAPKLIKKAVGPELRTGRLRGTHRIPGSGSTGGRSSPSKGPSSLSRTSTGSGSDRRAGTALPRVESPPNKKASNTSLHPLHDRSSSAPLGKKKERSTAAPSSGRVVGGQRIVDMGSELKNAIQAATHEALDNYSHHDDKLLKPVSNLGYTGQMQELSQVISREIYLNNPDVRWSDIIGLDKACKLVKEAVVYPIRYPQLFRGILSPWKGLLLYGPPGTGKTMLAKAIATECHTTFFNISASSIVSKWRGDSEKLVRVLFELARFHAPSTIFLDELDAIMTTRSSGGTGDHEGSRRMKTELLMQMDGLNKSDDLVFVLGASNLPWELDPAMLRRLEKRILVDLPTQEARRAMFQHHLPPTVQSEDDGGVIDLTANIDYDAVASNTDGYSGSDIRLVCKEAAMKPVRQIFDVLENLEDSDAAHHNITVRAITTEDVMDAIATTKPSAAGLRDRYTQWQKEFGSV
ncbi:hypothetical protein PTSG_08202 [Salpingoeca rosetta]|uniref:Katanin p60 ATPase-containing subunit A-like 2 n=1 Tax=Salpingoeca rosetta (strain ATCC 50818 / BSB-021) TaxID=946362 RepID=F2UIA5_SALR5|nr:uncharacterized protein PTSG_08202 [Salpingoeca rosetta]EGD76854.1 hypothetical protein PTSG_08202 [Salpingoeca rosetta]|eukprot:XP_004991226.1 hypothetical protein PTSG_08202 [Salpingoeca rosetta]